MNKDINKQDFLVLRDILNTSERSSLNTRYKEFKNFRYVRIKNLKVKCLEHKYINDFIRCLRERETNYKSYSCYSETTLGSIITKLLDYCKSNNIQVDSDLLEPFKKKPIDNTKFEVKDSDLILLKELIQEQKVRSEFVEFFRKRGLNKYFIQRQGVSYVFDIYIDKNKIQDMLNDYDTLYSLLSKRVENAKHNIGYNKIKEYYDRIINI